MQPIIQQSHNRTVDLKFNFDISIRDVILDNYTIAQQLINEKAVISQKWIEIRASNIIVFYVVCDISCYKHFWLILNIIEQSIKTALQLTALHIVWVDTKLYTTYLHLPEILYSILICCHLQINLGICGRFDLYISYVELYPWMGDIQV